jgi:DNA replication protein DnaC
MEELEKKHKDLIDKAFQQLASEAGAYERRYTNLSFGVKKMLRPAFIECFTRYDKTIPEGKFQWLPEYELVLDWLEDNKGKGLCLYGSCGRGKSNIILGVLKPLFLATGKAFPGFHASLLTSKDQIFTEDWNYVKYRRWKWSYIDELGSESLVNNYGERFEPFNEIINKAEQDLDILIISSNLSADLFLQRYGDRAIDRINRLCKMIEFKGESLR